MPDKINTETTAERYARVLRAPDGRPFYMPSPNGDGEDAVQELTVKAFVLSMLRSAPVKNKTMGDIAAYLTLIRKIEDDQPLEREEVERVFKLLIDTGSPAVTIGVLEQLASAFMVDLSSVVTP